MAGKRSASSDLNQDNWDREDDPEDPGTFGRAPEEVLKKRVFKTVKRRINRSEGGPLNVFNPVNLAKFTNKTSESGGQLFGFLSKLQSNVSGTNGVSEVSNHEGDGDKNKTKPVFSFGNKVEKEQKTNYSIFENPNNDRSKSELNSSIPMFSFGNLNSKNNGESDNKNTASTFKFGDQNKTEQAELQNKSSFENKKTNIGDIKKSEENPTNNDIKYYAKLKGLNESVAKWINKHVESNPLINLQPIFKDYENFFEEIENERKKNNNNNKSETPKSGGNDLTEKDEKIVVQFAFDSKQEQKPAEEKPKVSGGFTFEPKSVQSKIELPASAATFKFGVTTPSNNISSSPPTFKFGTANSSSSISDTFKFGSTGTSSSLVTTSGTGPKFSFGGNTSVSSTGFGAFSSTPSLNFGSSPVTEEKKDDEESDEPPKVDVEQVEEEGHIYTIRCKLFVKKDGNFVEKGIGSLFLKPVPESDKIQVIVRAHNSLGNILCNFILSSSIPTQRMGKNNVMIVCIPTPDSQPPPVPILIKVKTADDADQLLQTLEKYKK